MLRLCVWGGGGLIKSSLPDTGLFGNHPGKHLSPLVLEIAQNHEVIIFWWVVQANGCLWWILINTVHHHHQFIIIVTIFTIIVMITIPTITRLQLVAGSELVGGEDQNATACSASVRSVRPRHLPFKQQLLENNQIFHFSCPLNTNC